MEAWQQQYDRMTGLLKVYRAEGAVQLKEALFDCYRKLICDIEDRQRKEKALREKIRQLEEGGLLNVPEDVVVENVHLSESLMRLSYRVCSMQDRKEEEEKKAQRES